MHKHDHHHDLNVKKVDKLGPTRVRLSLEFPADSIEQHETQVAQRYVRAAKIPGFRPGKAPVSMVKEKYKEEIRQDVVSHLLEAGLSEALQKTNLNPVSRPKINLQEVAPGKPFNFEAEFDIQPEIELKKYKGIPVKKATNDASDEEVNKTFDNLRERMSSLEPVEETKAKKGLFANLEIAYEFVDGSQPKQPAQPFTIEVGSESLLPALDKGLVDMTVGETKVLTEKFPDDYQDKKIAGKEAKFECKLLELKKKVLPELNDEFANQVREGAKLEDLRREIRENIVQSKTEESKRQQRQEVVDYLIKNNAFEVAGSMVDAQASQLMQWMEEDWKKRGMKAPNLKKEDLQNVRERAERMVRSSLVLREVAVKEKITLDETKVDARLEAIASSLGRSVEDAKKFLEGKGMLDRIRDEILTDQVFDFLLGQAKIS